MKVINWLAVSFFCLSAVILADVYSDECEGTITSTLGQELSEYIVNCSDPTPLDFEVEENTARHRVITRCPEDEGRARTVTIQCEMKEYCHQMCEVIGWDYRLN